MGKQFIDFFDQLNPWWGNPHFRFQLHDRVSYTGPLINQVGRLIQILIGARRVGKTSILHRVINDLLNSGEKPKNIIFLSGELREIRENGIGVTLDNLCRRLSTKPSVNLHLFIDEVQEIDNWQNEIKLLYDSTNFRIYLSGSSSLLLAKQTGKLTGRYRLRHVLPLSFKEFLDFKNVKHKASAAILNDSLMDYLRIGGYPEYVLNKDPAYLRQCIESTLYRELMSAYGMRNPALLQDLLYFLADKVTNEVSSKRIQKDLKVDDKTAQFYLQYLRDVYLIYPAFKAGKSNRVTKGSNPKYYFNDPGVLALTAKTFRIGHAVENAVYLKLLGEQAYQELPRIEYAILDDQEVDFISGEYAYEVKALEDITKEILETYSDLGRSISLITLGDTKKIKNYSSSLSTINLKEFLLR